MNERVYRGEHLFERACVHILVRWKDHEGSTEDRLGAHQREFFVECFVQCVISRSGPEKNIKTVLVVQVPVPTFRRRRTHVCRGHMGRNVGVANGRNSPPKAQVHTCEPHRSPYPRGVRHHHELQPHKGPSHALRGT
jgi:hypothetical protein